MCIFFRNKNYINYTNVHIATNGVCNAYDFIDIRKNVLFEAASSKRISAGHGPDNKRPCPLFQAMVGAGPCVSYLKEKKKGCVCWRNASEPLGLAKKEQSSPAEG